MKMAFKPGDWPPLLDRLPLVQPEWSFRSGVMVWDIDISRDHRRIAAASSDCNVYILDFQGRRCARLEMESQVTQVRFIDDDLLLVNGRRGSIYGLRLRKEEGNAESLVLEFQRNFGKIENDTYGLPTKFSVAPLLGKAIIGYGNKNSGFGGIALMDLLGEVVWQQPMEAAVMDVSMCGKAICHMECGPIAVATTLNNKSQFSAYQIDESGNVKCIVSNASLISIAGVSASTGASLLGLTLDKASSDLIKFSPNGLQEQTFHVDEFPIRALFLHNDSVIVSANSSLEQRGSQKNCHVCAWKNHALSWQRKMVSQVYQLIFDEENQIILVSSMGQGNVYALSLNGEPLSCAKVELAPLCFRIDKTSQSLLVGSKSVTMFRLNRFV